MAEAQAPEAEREQLLKELNILTDKQDALKAMIDARKARLQAMMNDAGERTVESDYYGGAGFSPRRSFKVLDKEKLKRRVSKAVLVEGFKPTAAIVDAMAQEGISVKDVIGIGVNESFSYRRPATKEAKERRRRIIDESRNVYEAKVAEIMAAMAS